MKYFNSNTLCLLEDWISKRAVFSLKLLCMKAVTNCHTYNEINNLLLPSELKEILKKKYWKFLTIKNIDEQTQVGTYRIKITLRDGYAIFQILVID